MENESLVVAKKTDASSLVIKVNPCFLFFVVDFFFAAIGWVHRINDEVAGDGLIYHNTSLLVEHLRSSELRNAFNVESGFWNMVRDEQGDAMIRAILNVPQYEEHLFHSGLYKECIFNNWDSSVIVENEEFADYNNHFEELERRNLIVSMEYDEVIDLSRP